MHPFSILYCTGTQDGPLSVCVCEQLKDSKVFKNSKMSAVEDHDDDHHDRDDREDDSRVRLKRQKVGSHFERHPLFSERGGGEASSHNEHLGVKFFLLEKRAVTLSTLSLNPLSPQRYWDAHRISNDPFSRVTGNIVREFILILLS